MRHLANFTKPSPQQTTWAIQKLLLLGTVDDCTLGIRESGMTPHHPGPASASSRQTNPSNQSVIISGTIPGQPLNWCHWISPWFVFMLSQLLQDLLQDIWRGLHQSCWRNHGCGLWKLDAESSGSPGSYYHHIFWPRPELSKHLVRSQSPPHRMFFLGKILHNFPMSNPHPLPFWVNYKAIKGDDFPNPNYD